MHLKTHFRPLLLAVYFLFCSFSRAEAGYPVKFDCDLKNRGGVFVSCASLSTAFFKALNFLSPTSDDGEAKLLINVEANNLQTQTNYEFRLKSKGQDLAILSMTDAVPKTLTAPEVLLRLVGDLEKIVTPSLAILEPGFAKQGVVDLKLKSPDEGSKQGSEAATDTPWYVAPSLSGIITKTQSQQIDASAGATANYSDPNWRLQASGGVEYLRMRVPVEGKVYDGEAIMFSGRTIVALSLPAPQWSVALVMGGAHLPISNYKAQAGGGLGLEWNLVPFMKTDASNVSVRYFVYPEYDRYVAENLRGNLEEKFVRHALQLYLAWHFPIVDVRSSVSGSSIVSDWQYYQLSNVTNLVFQLTPNLQLSLTGLISFHPVQLNQWNQPPERLAFIAALPGTGSGFSDVTILGMLSLTYIFGNSLLNVQDQRWNSVPGWDDGSSSVQTAH